MSKVYIINQKDIDRLRDKLRLSTFESKQQKPEGVTDHMINDVWRSYNYHLESWIGEITQDPT